MIEKIFGYVIRGAAGLLFLGAIVVAFIICLPLILWSWLEDK